MMPLESFPTRLSRPIRFLIQVRGFFHKVFLPPFLDEFDCWYTKGIFLTLFMIWLILSCLISVRDFFHFDWMKRARTCKKAPYLITAAFLRRLQAALLFENDVGNAGKFGIFVFLHSILLLLIITIIKIELIKITLPQSSQYSPHISLPSFAESWIFP